MTEEGQMIDEKEGGGSSSYYCMSTDDDTSTSTLNLDTTLNGIDHHEFCPALLPLPISRSNSSSSTSSFPSTTTSPNHSRKSSNSDSNSNSNSDSDGLDIVHPFQDISPSSSLTSSLCGSSSSSSAASSVSSYLADSIPDPNELATSPSEILEKGKGVVIEDEDEDEDEVNGDDLTHQLNSIRHRRYSVYFRSHSRDDDDNDDMPLQATSSPIHPSSPSSSSSSNVQLVELGNITHSTGTSTPRSSKPASCAHGECVMAGPCQKMIELSCIRKYNRNGHAAATPDNGKKHLMIIDNACGPSALVTAQIMDKLPVELLEEAQFLATDLSEITVARATRRVAELEWADHVFTLQMDMLRMECLGDEEYTHVFTNFGVSLAKDARAALREMNRVLVPGGVCGFTVWKRLSWLDILAQAIKSEYKAAPGPFPTHDEALLALSRWYPWHKEKFIKKMLKEANFPEFIEKEPKVSSKANNLVEPVENRKRDMINMLEKLEEVRKDVKMINTNAEDWSAFEFFPEGPSQGVKTVKPISKANEPGNPVQKAFIHKVLKESKLLLTKVDNRAMPVISKDTAVATGDQKVLKVCTPQMAEADAEDWSAFEFISEERFRDAKNLKKIPKVHKAKYPALQDLFNNIAQAEPIMNEDNQGPQTVIPPGESHHQSSTPLLKKNIIIEEHTATHRYTKHEFMENFGTAALEHILKQTWGRKHFQSPEVKDNLRNTVWEYLVKCYPGETTEIELELTALVVVTRKATDVSPVPAARARRDNIW